MTRRDTWFGALKFKLQDGGFPDTVQAHMFFDNGYGASVIQGPFTLGGSAGLYELAVLVGTAENHRITYDTRFTGDVLGHLTPQDVTDYLKRIERLRPRKGD